jgi:hypothetical protein
MTFKTTLVKGTKVCFCVGAENCKDESCELVQKHKQRLKNGKSKNSYMC